MPKLRVSKQFRSSDRQVKGSQKEEFYSKSSSRGLFRYTAASLMSM